VELLISKREKRRQEVAPPRENIFQKYVKSYDQKGSYSIEDTNFFGFHPRVDWIARGSGAAVGVRYWRPDAFKSIDLMGSAFYSIRRYQLYDFQIGQIPNRGKRIPSKSFETEEVEKLGSVERSRFSRLRLYFSARFRDRTDESFYGSGPSTNQQDRRRYRVKDTVGEVVAGYQFSERFGWIFKFGAVNHSLAYGRSWPSLDDPPSLEPPGKSNPPNYFRSAASLIFDFRDHPGVPHSGFLVVFDWQRWNQSNGESFNFSRYGADIRGYIPLGSTQRVLALRSVFVNSDPDKGNSVPFFLQPSLGGGESLRGFDSFRFQGDKMVLAQIEYRWEASRRWEFALFADTGTVANKGSKLSVDDLKTDWGGGVRFKSSRTTLIRIDQAFSNEGVKTQVRFSAVF
jgi:outer membrane protein assembly factor BamA